MLASLHFLSLSPSLPSLFLTRNFASMPFLHKCIRSGLIGASEKKKKKEEKKKRTHIQISFNQKKVGEVK